MSDAIVIDGLDLNEDQIAVLQLPGIGKLKLIQRNSLTPKEEMAVLNLFDGLGDLTLRVNELSAWVACTTLLMRRNNPEITEDQVREAVPVPLLEAGFEFFLQERNGGKPPEFDFDPEIKEGEEAANPKPAKPKRGKPSEPAGSDSSEVTPAMPAGEA